MKKLLLLTTILAIALWSCSDEMTPLSSTTAKRTNPHKVSLSDAIDRADPILAHMSVNSTTRSLKSRRIESVQYYTLGAKTRGNTADTLFYVVNYADNEGFSVLGADDRILPVYAMSDEGHINLADTAFNGGLRIFVNQAADHANMLRDLGPIIGGFDPFDYRFDRRVNPKLSVGARGLSQYSPYNTYCYTTDGKEAYAGCGPIAVTSILMHFQMPKSIDGHTIDWGTIARTPKYDDLYWLIGRIGKNDYLNCSYVAIDDKDHGTSTLTTKIATCLRKCGLDCSDFVDFDKYEAGAELEKNPILIFGKGGRGNHFWIMDGYIRYGTLTTDLTTMPEITTQPIVHDIFCIARTG